MEDKEVLSQFISFEASGAYISKNYGYIQENFPDLYIAVEDGKVIASSKDFNRLMDKLKKMNKDPKLVVIEFIPHSGQIVLY